MKQVEYAVMIETGTETSLPSIGLYTGLMCVVTGTQGYGFTTDSEFVEVVSFEDDDVEFMVLEHTPEDLPLDFDVFGQGAVSPPERPGTLDPQESWARGVMLRESMGDVEAYVDPTLGGGYSTMTGMTLRLVNNLDALGGQTLFDRLRVLGINLYRKKARVYTVLDGVFRLEATFLVDSVVNEEHSLTIGCVDGFLAIHRDLLRVEVTREAFPDAPEDSLEDFVPLCLGYVPEAELIPLTSPSEPIVLRSTGLTTTYGLSMTTNTQDLVLLTQGESFTENELKGKKIAVVVPGVTGAKAERSYFVSEIGYNAATSGNSTLIKLVGPFMSEQNEPVRPEVGNNSATRWWFKVFDYTGFHAVSDSEVSQFRGSLLIYEDAFFDATARVIEFYPDGWEDFAGIAGARLKPDPDEGFSLVKPDPDEGFSLVDRISVPMASASIEFRAVPTVAVSDNFRVGGLPPNPSVDEFPAAFALAPLLVDGDLDTGYERAWNLVALTTVANGSFRYGGVSGAQIGNPNESLPIGEVTRQFRFRVPVPEDFRFDRDDRLMVGADFDVFLSSTGLNLVSGRTGYAAAVWVSLYDKAGVLVHDGSRQWLPMFIRNPDGSPRDQVAYKAVAMNDQNNISLRLAYPGAGGATYEHRSMSGEYYGDEPSLWQLAESDPAGGLYEYLTDEDMAKNLGWFEISFGAMVNTAYDTVTLTNYGAGFTLRELALFKAKDNLSGKKYTPVTGATFSTTWGGRKTIGAPAQTFTEAIEYLIRERDESTEINVPSFVEMEDSRPIPIWIMGRQITENKNSRDYIEELCKHLFAAIVPDEDGLRKLVALDGYTNPGITHVFDDANIIDGSVEQSPIHGLDRVFTGLEIRYDKNPATGEFRSVVYIRRTHEEAFPSYSSAPNAAWKNFAGGFGSDMTGYTLGRETWENYRKAYLLLGRDNPYKFDSEWFVSWERLRERGIATVTTVRDAPISLAWMLSQWYAVPRVQYSFRVDVGEKIRLLDRCSFRDIRRTGDLYYPGIVEGVRLIPALSQYEVTISRRVTDTGTAAPAVPTYITEIIGGDTITEVIGGDETVTEIINP